MTTIAQQLIEEGELKAKRDLLLQILRQRFGDHVGGEAEQRIATATSDQLDECARRVLAATTLAEVLGD